MAGLKRVKKSGKEKEFRSRRKKPEDLPQGKAFPATTGARVRNRPEAEAAFRSKEMTVAEPLRRDADRIIVPAGR
jgi:hypothetical protein